MVWCSSDDDAQEFNDYAKKMGPWLAVPFENAALRAQLKQQYGVCAAKASFGGVCFWFGGVGESGM